MKNIKLTILGVMTLLFALTLNFRHALDDYGVLKNKLHVEVLTQSNNSGGSSSVEWNDWTQWPSQGLTKDERELIRRCPDNSSSSGSGSISGGYGGASGSISGSGSSSQTNPPDRVDISCPYGQQNCTPVGC